MDLTKKYMEKQGTLGYLHKADREYPYKLLAYSREGEELKYYYCEEDIAHQVLDHWGSTGEFIREEFNFHSGQNTVDISHPTRVVVLHPEETYFRKMYPPEDPLNNLRNKFSKT